MFYYLYKITNTLNGKIYVGVHKTKSLDDGYMGSGKIIRSAIVKHGVSNFSKDILEYFDDSKSMYAREAEVVTEEFLLREDVYNLRRGGYGGFEYINANKLGVEIQNQHTPDSNRFASSKGGNIAVELKRGWFSDKVMHDKREFSSKGGITTRTLCVGRYSLESIEKRKEVFAEIGHQQGIKNSQFGKMWITNEVESKKIKKTDLIPEDWRKGRVLKQT